MPIEYQPGRPPVILPTPAMLRWELEGFGANIKPIPPPFKPSIADLLAAAEANRTNAGTAIGLDTRIASPTPVAATAPLNGGPGSWGGTSVGFGTVEGGGKVTDIKKGLSAVWTAGKWVAKKGDKFLLGPVGNFLTAKEIYDWAKANWPNDEPLPARVNTRFELYPGALRYEHPGGYWMPEPPAGYDKAGNYMWGQK